MKDKITLYANARLPVNLNKVVTLDSGGSQSLR
jgi:hypothetical protein